MTEYDIQNAIMEMIYDTELSDEIDSARTYEDGGYLTYDKGVVLRMKDGSEFQITIVQSN